MAFLAQVTYTGNGSTTQYSIPFEFIDSTHVKAFIDGTETSAFTISSSTLTFTTAPANASVIRIERQTPTDARLIDFTDGSVLTESDLDRSADQNFYIAQEITDDSTSKLGLDTDDKYDANNKVIKNLANPVNNTDAVNKQFISTNLPNITTVAGIASDVTTVANNNANVTAVANDATDIGTVATNIASVNTVATNINDVIKVADDLNEAISEVETVANDLNEATSEIEVVANNITNVNTVGTNISNVNTVATDIANVNSVAGNSTNINAVAGNATNINAVNANSSNINAVNANSANINTVAGDTTAINAVASDATDIGTVATNIANVNTVAGNNANITTVAGNNANVSTVAGISSNVTTVAGISADVTSVAGDATDIGTVATNIANVNSVAGNASNINTVATNNANVTTVAGSITNVNSVASNISGINDFADRYRVQAGEPSVNNDEGDLVYDTTANAVKVYNGTSFDTIQQGITDVAPTRHSIRPSLNLDFANSKVLDPRITFTRGSNATYYDGYTSVKAEENLFTYSQEFDNSDWNKLRSTITANDTTAPDGTTTAERLAQTTGQSVIPLVRQYKSFVNGNDYTLSCYGKAGDRNFLVLRQSIVDGTARYTHFNLSTGTIGASDAVHTATITDVGNSWYRCSITFTAGSTNSSSELVIGNGTTDVTINNADDNGYIYIWGAQLEKRDSLTAYTATSGTPITKYQPALQTAGNNVARFDHNPTTGESLGLLIEESRTNLQVYSEEFDNGAWNKINSSITPNTIIAPDGTLTGDKLIADTSTGIHRIQDSFSVTTGTTYVYSIYAKQAEETECTLNFASVELASFNLANGTTTLGSGNVNTVPQSSSITDVGNGWYRCSVVWYRAGVNLAGSYEFFPREYSTYAGDGYSGIYIWGAQVEAGTFETSYIKTTGSQVTRSADSAVMNNIDTSDWFKQGEGTIYGDVLPGSVLSNKSTMFFANSNSLNENSITLYCQRSSSVGYLGLVEANNVFQLSASSQTNADGKTILAYKTNDFAVTRNGATAFVYNNGIVPNGIDIVYIGDDYNGGNAVNGTIKKIAYYPKRLTNNEIQDLTEE